MIEYFGKSEVDTQNIRDYTVFVNETKHLFLFFNNNRGN